MTERRGGILHEKDGDFNPGWAIVILFSALGAFGSLVVFLVALRDGAKATVMVGAAFGFIAFTLVTAATMVVQIGRAKILNNSRTLAAVSKAFRAGGGNIWTDDERDPDWERDDDHAARP